MSNSAEDHPVKPAGTVPKRGPGLRAMADVRARAHDPNDGGGPVLSRAQVQLIYWGTAWHKLTALKSQIDGAVRSILGSGYVKALSEYRSDIGEGHLAGSQVHAAGNDPHDDFTDAQVKALLAHMINSNLLPQPDNDQHLYLVITPPGISVSEVLGEHWFFSHTTPQGTKKRVHYGWITGTKLNEYTCTISHEIVESITDPEMNGITFDSCPGVDGTCEIGDVCETCYKLDDGTVVQDWYSKKAHRCIEPK